MNGPLGREILERTWARHGGWDCWQSVHRLELTLTELGGPLPLIKGLHKTFPAPRRIGIWPHECRTVFLDYPHAGSSGVFERGRVRLVRPGDPPAEGEAYRSHFAGIEKYRRWSPLDALYFFGYALWHYHVLPFALADATIVDAAVSGGGRSRLVVDFPPEVETHSRRQTFHFDPRGLIVRHDYVAEIVGWWAAGAHEWSDYETMSGLPVARRRQVWARVGGRRLPIPVLHARLGDGSVFHRDQQAGDKPPS